MMLFLYRLFSILLSPLIDLYLFFRKLNNKEDEKRFKERLGFSSNHRPDGFLVMIHCASVGESNSALPFIDYLQKKHPQIRILFTSGTVTSAAEMMKKLPRAVIHQFVPVDKLFSVKRFINHWRPNLTIFFESEVWPNLILESKKNGCPLILMNARISDKSFKRWQFLHKIGFNILKNFDLCFVQSKKDLKLFTELGLQKSYFFGNLKSLAVSSEFDQESLNIIKNSIKNRINWLAASTHHGEEIMVINAHQQLKTDFPDLLTILVPRHPNRADEIIELIKKAGLNYKQRSKKELPTSNCDIYLADTMGELPIFYQNAKFSLIGGSMIDNIGGHTPYEALAMNCLPISGPYVSNFEEVYKDLESTQQAIMLSGQDDLVSNIKQLFQDSDLLPKNSQNASSQQSQQLLAKITQKLTPFLEPIIKNV